jgi:hypothetical protein
LDDKGVAGHVVPANHGMLRIGTVRRVVAMHHETIVTWWLLPAIRRKLHYSKRQTSGSTRIRKSQAKRRSAACIVLNLRKVVVWLTGQAIRGRVG